MSHAITGEPATGLCAKCLMNTGKPFLVHPCGAYQATGPKRYDEDLVIVECDLYDRTVKRAMSFLTGMTTDHEPADLERVLRSFTRKNRRLRQRIDELKYEKHKLILKCIKYQVRLKKKV